MDKFSRYRHSSKIILFKEGFSLEIVNATISAGDTIPPQKEI
jgi:hypothetical protein